MASYFGRNSLDWTLAPDNLDHWLEAGGLQDPAQIMDYTLIKDQELVIDTLVDEHYDVIVDGIKKRLLAPPDAEFPASPTTFTGPFGDPIEVNPAESPLAAGGEETLYYESSTHTTDDSTSDLFNAVNAVNLVSQVQVKSEVLYTGEWQVTIVDWQVWFWDSYDWNKEGQPVRVDPPQPHGQASGGHGAVPAHHRGRAEKKLDQPVGAAEHHREGCPDEPDRGQEDHHAGRKHQAAQGLPDLQQRFVVFRCEHVRQGYRSDDTAAVSERLQQGSGEHAKDILYRA